MKVLSVIGSGRKKNTYNAATQFVSYLSELTTDIVEHEVVMLADYTIETCTGCLVCLDKGDELCPLKDDRDIILKKIDDAYAVVFASPNYSFQLSGLMKVFIDRLGFIFHRPRYFDKKFTSIVTQGIYGGSKIVKYFDFIGNALGFQRVKGASLTTIQPATEKQEMTNEKKLRKLAKRLFKQLAKKKLPKPGLFELMIFRASRSRIKKMLNEEYKDFRYYHEQGWFESDFYYPVKLNPVKKLMGKLFDKVL